MISRRRLREFWEAQAIKSEQAERQFSACYKSVKAANWPNFVALKQTFGSADRVGNYTVFDVGNNRWRLIGRMNFAKGTVYNLRVMDHAEFDRKTWIETCGCHRPPPGRRKGNQIMSTRAKPKRVTDSYFKLVRKFPLTHLQDESQLARAEKLIDQLLQCELDEGSQQYLDVLTDLVEDFEEKHFPIPDASEGEVLQELMTSNRLNQTQMAKKTGIAQSTISAVLSGHRSLTRDQIVVLARLFGISPAAFLPI